MKDEPTIEDIMDISSESGGNDDGDDDKAVVGMANKVRTLIAMVISTAKILIAIIILRAIITLLAIMTLTATLIFGTEALFLCLLAASICCFRLDLKTNIFEWRTRKRNF